MLSMAICSECDDEFSDARYNLGYTVCLKCGENSAKFQAKEKAKRVAPLYSKGGLQYITDGTIKNDANSIGRKV